MDNWIFVKDMLPENADEVLVWFEYFRYGDFNCLYQTYGIGEYFEQYNSWMINHETGWRKLRVIAWVPMPEPPNGTATIFVKDMLPENADEVLVWFEYFRYGDFNCLYQTYGIGEYFEQYNSWMINHETGWHKLRVIAWVPMPEPPKGK